MLKQLFFDIKLISIKKKLPKYAIRNKMTVDCFGRDREDGGTTSKSLLASAVRWYNI